MHKELAGRRREAVQASGKGQGAAHCGRKRCPGRGGGVERVEVITVAWQWSKCETWLSSNGCAMSLNQRFEGDAQLHTRLPTMLVLPPMYI
jgi:hypothetical protein